MGYNEVDQLIKLNSRVGSLEAKTNDVKEDITELKDMVRAIQEVVQNKRRPIVLGLGGGGLGAAMVQLVTWLTS